MTHTIVAVSKDSLVWFLCSCSFGVVCLAAATTVVVAAAAVVLHLFAILQLLSKRNGYLQPRYGDLLFQRRASCADSFDNVPDSLVFNSVSRHVRGTTVAANDAGLAAVP